jgi:hypothetical protein
LVAGFDDPATLRRYLEEQAPGWFRCLRDRPDWIHEPEWPWTGGGWHALRYSEGRAEPVGATPPKDHWQSWQGKNVTAASAHLRGVPTRRERFASAVFLTEEESRCANKSRSFSRMGYCVP